jgi:large subunit ribosomal protein L23
MAELTVWDIILRPVVSEKSNRMQEGLNQYVFEVAPTANKTQIRDAIETIFQVRVERVNVMNVPAKRGRRGRKWYLRSPQWKKAIVSLEPGATINLFNV